MRVPITGQHIPLDIKVRLLQFYVHYFDIIILRFLWRWIMNRVIAKIKGLEHLRLIKVRVLMVNLISFINLRIFNHFFYLYYTFPLFKSVCPLTLGLVSRSKHELTYNYDYSYKF